MLLSADSWVNIHDSFLLDFSLLFHVIFIIGKFDCALLLLRHLSDLKVSEFARALTIIPNWAIYSCVCGLILTSLFKQLLVRFKRVIIFEWGTCLLLGLIFYLAPTDVFTHWKTAGFWTLFHNTLVDLVLLHSDTAALVNKALVTLFFIKFVKVDLGDFFDCWQDLGVFIEIFKTGIVELY